MGPGGIGIWQLLIILVIILLIFGTKKLRNLGSDLGGALKGFKSAMDEGKDEENKDQAQISSEEEEDGDTFDVKAEKVNEQSNEKEKA